jgi:hypothetical protein
MPETRVPTGLSPHRAACQDSGRDVSRHETHSLASVVSIPTVVASLLRQVTTFGIGTLAGDHR